MNKTKVHEAVNKTAIPIKLGIAGRKRLIVRKAKDMSIVQDTGWTNNLITNAGLDSYCGGGTHWTNGYCEVGTGNTAPANTDTSLVTLVAQTNTKISGASQTGWNSTDDYVYHINGWQFSDGTFSGQNLAEVGFKGGSTDDLCSRSLMLDGVGSPTTVTVQSDEVLQVYYEFRLYYPTADINTSVIDSTTAVNHTVVIRPSEVDGSLWRPNANLGFTSSQQCIPYEATATLGAIDASPSGASATTTTTFTKNTYTPGDYFRRQSFSFSLTQGNASGGIGALRYSLGSTIWQCSWSPAVAKDNTKKWDVEFEVSVSRAVI